MRGGLFLRIYSGILAVILVAVLVVSGIMVTLLGRQQQMFYENEVRLQAEEVAAYMTELNQMSRLWENQAMRRMVDRKMQDIQEKYNADIWIVSYEMGYIQYIDSGWNTAKEINDPAVNDKLWQIQRDGKQLRVQGLFSELGNQIVTIGVPWMYNDETVVGAVLLHINVDRLGVNFSDIAPGALLAAMCAGLVGAVAAWFMARAQTRPIRAIRRAVMDFAKGDFSRRVKIASGSGELSDLADSVNRMANELSNLEESRKAFVSNVSHELRSPLTCVQGYVQGMLDGTIPQDEHPRYMQVVLDETRRLTKLVSDLLKLSRYESGKVPLNIVRFDINELLRRSIIAFGARLDEKNVDVHVDLPGGECYVMADEDRISQVLVNLTDNALKFLPEAGGRLDISVVPGAREAQIRIADNGPGIAQEDLPHIFDRFYKADKAHTSGMGTGLGLSIVRRILNDHGQQITVQSGPGSGAEFVFTLEMAKDQTRRGEGSAESNL